MTIFHIDVTHTIACTPGWPQPHVIATLRTILGVSDSVPCQAPVNVYCGDNKAVIACGRHQPAERQCGACRITIVETVIRLRYQGPHRLFLDGDGWLCELINADPQS